VVWKGENPPSGIAVAFFFLTHLVYRGLLVGQGADIGFILRWSGCRQA